MSNAGRSLRNPFYLRCWLISDAVFLPIQSFVLKMGWGMISKAALAVLLEHEPMILYKALIKASEAAMKAERG